MTLLTAPLLRPPSSTPLRVRRAQAPARAADARQPAACCSGAPSRRARRVAVACATLSAAATPLPPSRVAAACSAFASAFPLWVSLGALTGAFAPHSVAWFRDGYVVAALALTMFGAGVTLDTGDLRTALSSPREVAAGVALQYTVMPFLAWALATALRLPPPLAVGLILVGCCPGGTASNIVALLAGANVALSVVLTACSTVLAAAATPALTAALAGTLVAVPAASLCASTVNVVLAPVVAGLLLQRFAPAAVAAASPLAGPVGVATVALLCASVIASAPAGATAAAGPRLATAVVGLHVGGFALGYAAAAALGFPERVRRTLSIEVGSA